MKTTIYHNPRCSKSRESLQLLQEKELDYTIVEYLKTPPTRSELQDLLAKLDLKPSQLIRKTEAIYKEHYKGKSLQEDEWMDAMLNYPRLIQRPIVIHGNKAVIGRPIDQVKELLESS